MTGTFACKVGGHLWHVANAFEESVETPDDTRTELVIDASAADTIATDLDISYMARVRIPLFTASASAVDPASPSAPFTTPTATLTKLCPKMNLEFPQVNPLVHHQPYSFAYVLENAGTTSSALVKLDVSVEGGKVAAKALDTPGWLLSEPVFVPSHRQRGILTPEGESEGVVLVTVTDTKATKGSPLAWLSVLNPQTLAEMMRVQAPIAINAGLHSHFFPIEPLACKL